jgi:hypothetical protein
VWPSFAERVKLLAELAQSCVVSQVERDVRLCYAVMEEFHYVASYAQRTAKTGANPSVG